MTLLVDFLCRFGWGLSLALVLTPAALVPGGFFRVNLLVILGLSTFAALLARTAVPGSLWFLPAVTAIAAWMGSIVWLAERRRAGLVFCGVCAALLAAATVSLAPGWPVPGWPVLARLLSGLVVGLTVHAMLLGHWYLNAPGMRIDALERAIDVALAVWGVTVVAAVGPLLAPGGIGPGDATTWALVALRWLTGIVALPILLVMSRRTLAIPNTQSATGILYVACLAAILGELTAQLLGAAAAGGA